MFAQETTHEVPYLGSSSGRQPAPGSQNGRYNVLFLCADNSAVSIIAEALLRRWGGDRFCAFSAGGNPRPEVHPTAVDMMKTKQVWHTSLRTKGCQEFLGDEAPRMDFIISVGERAPAGLPSKWPGHPRVMHWRISEPLANGSPAEEQRTFRKTFTELETRVRLFALVNARDSIKRAAA